MIRIIKREFADLPIGVMFTIILLTGIGLLSLLSISLNQGLDFLKTSFFKQLLFLIPALTGFFIALLIPRQIIHKYVYIFYLIAIGGILLPYLSGPVAGTHRWFSLGFIAFQPSEYAKWIIVLTLARYLSDHNHDMHLPTALIIPLIITFIPMFIVLKQPDLGTAFIMLTPVFPMLYWVGARPFHLFLIIAPLFSVLTAFHTISFSFWAFVMAVVFYLARPKLLTGIVIYFGNIFLGLLAPVIWNLLKGYQQQRILTVFNPELDPLGAAYQIIQSITAIGSGGIFGKGWGQGTQTQLKFLPVQETDFILSVIGEEYGFIMIFSIMLLFTWFILKLISLAYASNDRFSGLVLVGIAMIFISHLFVNAAMTIGLIPVKGLPLPFISYGGSFLLSCYIMAGLALNLSINTSD